MTSYTVNRRYPYPSSEREAGNGGLHSEMLARAVAGDLDAVDAEWALLLQRPTIVLSLPGDVTPISASGSFPVSFTTIDKQVGTDIAAGGFGGVEAVASGWYHLTLQLHSRANGTITAAAMHRISLEHVNLADGQFNLLETFYAASYQSGSLDMYVVLDCVVHLESTEEIRVRFYHTNTGSDARVVAAGSHLTAVQIVKD